MSDVEDIEDHFSEGDDTYSTFDCPKCETTWGHSRYCDPPGDMVETIKCTCGAVLKVSGEWVSEYRIDAELMDE